MDDDTTREAVKMALGNIRGDAKRARIAHRLPEEQRPKGFMVQIGMLPHEEPDGDEGSAEGMVAPGEPCPTCGQPMPEEGMSHDCAGDADGDETALLGG